MESIIVLAYTKPIDSQRQKKENFLLSADSAGKVMIARARAAVSENKTGNNLVVYQLTSKDCIKTLLSRILPRIATTLQIFNSKVDYRQITSSLVALLMYDELNGRYRL